MRSSIIYRELTLTSIMRTKLFAKHGECLKMPSKKYDRKNARAILTVNEKKFLNSFPKAKPLSSNQRHYMSSIENKTRKAFEDLNLILEKHPYPYFLFSGSFSLSLEKPIKEVINIVYSRKHLKEFLSRRKNKIKRKVRKKIIIQQTRKELLQIIDSVLNSM